MSETPLRDAVGGPVGPLHHDAPPLPAPDAAAPTLPAPDAATPVSPPAAGAPSSSSSSSSSNPLLPPRPFDSPKMSPEQFALLDGGPTIPMPSPVLTADQTPTLPDRDTAPAAPAPPAAPIADTTPAAPAAPPADTSPAPAAVPTAAATIAPDVTAGVADAPAPTLPTLPTAAPKPPAGGHDASDGSAPTNGTDAEPVHPMAHLMPSKAAPSESSRRAAELRAAKKAKSRKITLGVAAGALVVSALVGPPLFLWLRDAINEAGNTSTEEPAD